MNHIDEIPQQNPHHGVRPPTKRRPWSIQVKIPPQPLRPTFERCKREGYDMIEWRAPTPGGHTQRDTDLLACPDSVAELRELAAEFGLETAYHAPQGQDWHFGILEADLGRERFRESIVRAAAIDARYMTFHMGLTTGGERRRAIEQGAAIIREHLAFAEDRNVLLCVENVFAEHSVATPQDCDILFDTVNDSRLAFTLDTGHAHLDRCMHELLDIVAERLAFTHIHDNDGQSDQHRAPGNGSIDWNALMAHLDRIGYVGPLNFELRQHTPLAQLTRFLAVNG